ncbi:MAG TPA: TIGR03013 family XrtA/PEP-CTERM system glycosyltransferase [Candidatus Tectomicrobia bacterium]|nr:TIGR03013 family XrtA/PEP-CTERM system glycosyltransferase [Candidatus Tectomicrobia bacterium]
MLLVVLAADIAAVLVAVSIAEWLGPWSGDGPVLAKMAMLAIVVVFSLHLADLYKGLFHLGRREMVARLLLALLCSALLAAALDFAIPALRFGRLAFLHTFGLLAAGLLVSRLGCMALGAAEPLRTRVLVLGAGPAAAEIVALQTSGWRPYTVLGFLDDDPGALDALPAGIELLGKSRDLITLVEELRPDIVLVALRDMRGSLPIRDLLECRLRGIRVEDWPTFYEKQTGRVLVTDLRPSWLIFADGFVKNHVTEAVKRSIDVLVAGAMLAATLPVMAVIAVAIRLDSRGPILFRQERVGQHGRIFVLRKFRSMHEDAEAGGRAVWATPGDPRVTRVGRILRKTRLDELPQLINVLVGDMSFVGPRPERPEFVRTLQRQIPFYTERLSVKPGLTGWAQVSHHYAASVDDSLVKLQYDLYYIKNLSPFLDLLILLSTIQVVLFARGAR